MPLLVLVLVVVLVLGLVQKQLPILAPLLPLPVRNERGVGRGEGRLLECLNYACGSVLILAQTLNPADTTAKKGGLWMGAVSSFRSSSSKSSSFSSSSS